MLAKGSNYTEQAHPHSDRCRFRVLLIGNEEVPDLRRTPSSQFTPRHSNRVKSMPLFFAGEF